MHVQDKRAIETMCSCGINLEGIYKLFPMFSKEEIQVIFQQVRDKNIEEQKEDAG